MRIKEAELAASIIQVMHPGGMQAFLEAHGGLMYIPQPIDMLLIKSGPLGEGAKQRIKEAIPEGVEFVDKENFSFMEEDMKEIHSSIVQWIDQNLSPADTNVAMLVVTPLACIISLETLRKGSKLAIKFEGFLQSLPGHGRSFVIYDEGSYSRVNGEVGMFEPALKVEASKPKRETIIDDDDLLNLKIALGNAQTVDEFINSI